MNPILCTLVTLTALNMQKSGFTGAHEQQYVIKVFYWYNVKYSTARRTHLIVILLLSLITQFFLLQFLMIVCFTVTGYRQQK